MCVCMFVCVCVCVCVCVMCVCKGLPMGSKGNKYSIVAEKKHLLFIICNIRNKINTN